VSDELSIPRSPVYRVPRRRGPDPLTRRLMIIAGGLAGALVVIVGVWSAVGHRGGGTVPVVQADQRPVRVKPDNPGGMQIPGLSADAGAAAGSADRLAPAPETPDPQGLARQTPPPAPLAPPMIVGAAGSGAPGAGGAVQPGFAGAPGSGGLSPVAAKPGQVGAKPASGTTADRHGPAGRTQVQLAAVGTEAAARQAWDRLAHRMPGVVGGHHPVFSKVERDGHTLWRVRTGEFSTEAEAGQFCEQVKAKGGGCTVAVF
jgi:hypothetical protein